MTKTPQRYPLAWPAGRPRRKHRERGAFSMTVENKGRKVSIEEACNRLEDQITRLGGVYAVLSTNLELRMDGRPRADRAAPGDPGACVYFQMASKPYAMACDTYDEVAQNIAALAAHIEATRRITRYGVASAAETLQAFSALPPPAAGPVAPVQRPWRVVLGFGTTDPASMDVEDAELLVQSRYRRMAKELGADNPGLAELNLARDAALAELRGAICIGDGPR